ncbi:hypothetical protein B0H11DRAFT_2229249 [Mycena galericulata]|nr:hypothetical protein B0H11DRAFT_2260181 [Mycena galericulata]KAJ7433254.1 hypothetical protein B0H11DRAFT_2376304 [Mycena galericulata]KAJ7439143.1 hypothetical protein B0H11DRAFT_2254067 [Mycena galericulata]KAJ7490342.1 hypothetical protein B0H11DRAFT_2229249 [Mycena galericulata]
MGPKPNTKTTTAKSAKAAKSAKSPTAESQLTKLIAKQKKTEKDLALAKAQLLAQRNREMLDAEDEEEEVRPKKKSKGPPSSSPPPSDTFGEDDVEEMSSLLGSDRDAPDPSDTISVHGSDDGNDEPSEGEDNNGEEMVVDDVAAKTPKKAASRRKGAGPTVRVTQSTFSPLSVRLANAGRSAVRVGIATEDGFPTDHKDFAWKAITDVVASTEVPELTDRLEMARKSEERRSQLTNYAWSGAPQLRGELKNHSKSAVALYGIPGEFSPPEIVEHIKFLLGKKGVFKFGGIDLKARTFNVQQPYGASFYRDVMAKQWFDTVKSEGVRAATFERFIDAPIPTLALVTDAMENSLKEWATGVRIQVKFTEEEFGPRYLHHRAALVHLQTKSPTWFAQFQRGLYSKIVSNTSFSHLKDVVAKPGEDELDGIDFDALEASAVPTPSAAPAPPAVPAPAAVPAVIIPASAIVSEA